MKAIIIDDERLARAEMQNLLAEYKDLKVVAEAKNAEEGIMLIKEHKPDVIFCDVQMPGMNGFEMVKKLEEIPKVVFVTAFDEHAIKAFEVNALDYLLKPVDPDRLNETIEKLLKEEDDYSSTNNLAFRKERVLDATDKVFLKDGEKCFYVSLADIRYFESKGNYVKVYFGKHKPMILRSLNSLEDRLNPEQFFRANRKFIVNLNYITHIENWFNGGLQITLEEDEKIEISRRQAIKFKDVMSL
ncbi:two component transcriptional regulator, LytTR family [Lishizhenia tianjinensis]|uniref:Two component transcriptional regulator, LytTR family n=1 Tax=Lishizhenia tianjinensis TaxID=477690 RepID=A0A1I6YIF1_9FLAO|nr:LytTR family DNA-binding domain-containing protein [Lishizhenia tianjinensis]SFT50295.1 two component transcriptional regulator, LytTR family [Lishizhenia tianjinensis]